MNTRGDWDGDDDGEGDGEGDGDGDDDHLNHTQPIHILPDACT